MMPKILKTPRAPKVNVADELVEALGQAVAIMRGEREPGRVHLVPDVPDVRGIRTGMGLTREAFAERFGLKVAAVRDWEQGLRTPDPSARTLLKVIQRHPETVAGAVAA